MTTSRWPSLAIRATLLAALVAGTANVAMAQKDKPSGVTKGAIKSNDKADKGQATAEAARVAARERKAVKSAFKSARAQPKALFKGLKFNPLEKRMNKEITERYLDQYKTLEKAYKASDKAGQPDASIIATIDGLRLKERVELRAAVAPAQQPRFDSNAASLDFKRS